MACGACVWQTNAPPRCSPASTARSSCICSSARPSVPERLEYLRDGGRIYERSFAIIRAEADLSRFSAGEADLGARLVYACGWGGGGKRDAGWEGCFCATPRRLAAG